MDEQKSEKLTIATTDIALAVMALLVALSVLGAFIGGAFGWYESMIDWIYSKNWRLINTVLAIIFSILNALLLGFVIVVVRRHARLVKSPPKESAAAHPIMPKEGVRLNWEEIRRLANSSNPSDWNMAVLRADSLLNDVLGDLGYQGDTMAERLKIVDPTKLRSLEEVWSAHRLRNMIAHDPLEQHTRETIVHALRSYEQALKELDMMEEESRS